MAAVSFWNQVTYQPFVPPSFGKRVLEKVEDLSWWNEKRVCVIPGHENGKSEGVTLLNDPATRSRKKATLCFLLIVPVLIAKVILRSIYHFHLIQPNDIVPPIPPFVGADIPPPAGPSGDLSTNPSQRSKSNIGRPLELLEFNKKYQLSFSEVVKLQIEVPMSDRGQYLLQALAEWYVVPPSVNIGRSKLPIYKDSYFEYEYCKNSSDTFDVEVVRRKHGSFVFESGFASNVVVLTVEEIVDLKLLPIGNGQAVSVREEFKGIIFNYVYDSAQSRYQVWQQIQSEPRKYPFVPFNQVVKLQAQDARLLQHPYQKDLGNGWFLCFSEIFEYNTSVFLFREDKGFCTYVRMLRPNEEIL